MNKKFSRGLQLLLSVQIFAIACFAQTLKIHIKIDASNQSVVNVAGEFPENLPEKNLLFLLSYADSDNLGARIKNLDLADKNNQKVNYRKISEGSFAADAAFNKFSYQINAEVSQNILSTAHISWISEQKGILRLNDLLPDFETSYKTDVLFELPADWQISSTEKRANQNDFTVKNTENSVFVIGKGWSSRSFDVSGAKINLILDEQWKIERSVAEKIVRDILLEYENNFGALLEKDLNITIFRFPKDVGFERWRAETLRSNVLIMSAPTTFESQMRQRIQEQLRHELFHLWMPNNLKLSGNYAWFYEGFAQYAALKIGVKLNQISFGDFLNTLEQAHNLANRRSQPISLIEASKNRWLGENSSVYAKGFAVAFLFDTAMLKQSGGKRDVLWFLRQFYDRHKQPGKMQDGNAAVLSFSESFKELSPIAEDYVKGAKHLNFEIYLRQTGIEIEPNGSNIKLRVKPDLNGREKDFLDKLGYNNWRKFIQK